MIEKKDQERSIKVSFFPYLPRLTLLLLKLFRINIYWVMKTISRRRAFQIQINVLSGSNSRLKCLTKVKTIIPKRLSWTEEHHRRRDRHNHKNTIRHSVYGTYLLLTSTVNVKKPELFWLLDSCSFDNSVLSQ